MKNKFIWNIVNSVLLTTLFVVFMVVLKGEKEEIVYLNNVMLFSKFNMTKDLGVLNEKKYEVRVKRFDSLVNEFKMLENKLKLKAKNLTKKEEKEYVEFHKILREEEQNIESIKVQVKQDINQKVWNRLNSYVKQYGEENKMKLIIGTQGKGNIMYGDPLQNITQEIIEYANQRYEGE